MMLGKYIKQPAEVESYMVDYTDDLTQSDGVVSSEVVVHPPGELVVSTVDTRSDSVRIWLREGVDGNKYKVEVTVTTEDGRVMQDEFIITVKDI